MEANSWCEIWGNYVSYHIYVFLDVSTARDVFLWRNYIFFILIHLLVFLEEKCVSECYLTRKTSLSSFSDEQHSFTRNWAQNEDLMLGGQFLCEIWGNYVSYHIYVFLDVSTARDVFLWRNYIFFILIHLLVFLEEKCVSEWFWKRKTI